MGIPVRACRGTRLRDCFANPIRMLGKTSLRRSHKSLCESKKHDACRLTDAECFVFIVTAIIVCGLQAVRPERIVAREEHRRGLPAPAGRTVA